MVALLGSCSAIDNFGKFTVGTSVDMSGGGCTPGCDCIAADAALGVPEHCRVVPLNGFNCAGAGANHSTITLAPGTYQLDSGAVPPVLSDANSVVVMTGVQSNGDALFCVGSLVGDQGVHVIVVNDSPVVIIADSMIRLTSGSWSVAGGYATDRNGASGAAGGSGGGTNGNAGQGAGGGKGGSGTPGTGGGGGGSVSTGAIGGASAGGSTTIGGSAGTMPAGGFGGGAGGAGSSFGGGGGGGGGALQMSASWAVVLSSVIFDATGGGGAGGGAAGATTGATAGGGGGGGGGGIVIFDAPEVSVTGGCVSVVGGPGGAGGALARGGDAHPAVGCGFIGTAGIAPPNGGGGGTPGTGTAANAVGGTGTGIGGGGGGIGGAGRVTVRSHNPPPQATPPGVIPMTAYVPMTLP
jgi:hypothetical protein